MIITGAPIDRLDFSAVHYYSEVTQLLDVLAAHHIPQLNVCWGAEPRYTTTLVCTKLRWNTSCSAPFVTRHWPPPP